VYALKVLDGNGTGLLSAMLSAVAWVLSDGVKLGIRVINLSLTSYFDPTGPYYADTYSSLCSIFQQASDAGVIVVASSGNYGTALDGYFPAACDTVLAVTALDASGQAAASYSNWLPAAHLTEEDRRHVIAAPGTGINSTVPTSIDPSGYKVLSGTSMAGELSVRGFLGDN
jgi:hypothetical protein